MKKIIYNVFILAAALLMVACQKNKYNVQPMQIPAPDRSLFHVETVGNSYSISWETPKDSTLYLCYAYYVDGSQREKMTPDTEHKNKFVIESTETQQEYEVVFKYCTKKDMLDGAMSLGTVFTYTRGGAGKVQDLTVEQIEDDKATPVTNTAVIRWSPVATADSYLLTINVYDKKGEHKETMMDNKVVEETRFEFPAEYGQKWEAIVQGKNAEGLSLPVEASMLIGKTKNAFFSLYPTVADLMANGDDDEQAAWLLLQEKFPKMQYLYLGDIAENPDLLTPLRMGFFVRDKETGFGDVWDNWEECAKLAAPAIGNWVKNGGNLCLWSHACPYIGWIGRIPASELGLTDKWEGRISGDGVGGFNGDGWTFGVSHSTDQFRVDHNNHPLFRGIPTRSGWEGRIVAIGPAIGAGWKEDHNCGWFDRPGWWTGEPNNTQACYDKLVKEFGVTPLGTWDGDQCQWISQLLVWEAGPAENPNPMFDGNSWEGTVLVVGNGGFEIAQNKPDGSKDITRSQNAHQDVIDKLVENAVNYLMSK
ncbi:MAG: hypothetical protein MJZ89_06095 [Paludibacteraceae bacterium]|nr:hypothetical protein [Paludibacteraceae bacterium]